MMSNCQPSLRAMASAFGTFGVSMKPNRRKTRENVLPTGWMRTRSPASTRGVSARLDGQNDVLLVQHLVMLEAMEKCCYRAARPASADRQR